MWFEKLVGFSEGSPAEVRKNLSVNGEILKSHINNKEYICGRLETPSLAELRTRAHQIKCQTQKISVREVIADVQKLHIEELNADSLFQVASQFNLLEMVSPNITPEQGVSGYEYDRTQGPACAIAAGAGTIYRNYFAKVNCETGQTSNNQIDCLADIGTALGNVDSRLWEMKNGYALASEEGLKEISDKIKIAAGSEVDEIRKLLRIGVQWGTEVTLNDSKHTVTQAYCSALPVAYSNQSPVLWEAFAKVILEASYEALICVGILNYHKTGNNKVYITLIGGGAFGNKTSWIINAIERSLNIYKNVGLDVIVVSHGSSNRYVKELIDRHQSK